MPNAKNGVDQSRRFGFKETREQYESRKKQEKQLKWDEKLSKESLSKLRRELDSLNRARFLAPQQNERKRLVTKMIKDLEARYKSSKELEPVVLKEPSPPQNSDSEEDNDFLFSRNATTYDEDRHLFVPRSLRKKQDVKITAVENDPQRTAEEAEKELLAVREEDDILDAFLDGL